jgi:nucleoside-diphosphate-sugar epimerase
MSEERYLVTGAMGCIGAWAVKRLLDDGATVYTYDLATNPHRLRLIMDDRTLSKVNILSGDVTNLNRFESVVRQNRITHIIHLAAWQVPLVKADPVVGAAVNIVGTTVVLETARRCRDQVRGLVYASSAGVFSPNEANPSQPLTDDTPLNPPTLYGVFKQANEGTARIYWQDYQVSSLCLRPCGIVYGPGRDQGMSSPPSKALLAAAAGRDYSIAFDTSTVFEYAGDVAGAFIQGVRAGVTGAPVCNLGGVATTVSDLVALIADVLPEARDHLTIADQMLVGPIEVDEQQLTRLIGPVHWTPPSAAVRETIEIYRRALEQGTIDVDRVLSDQVTLPTALASGES